MMCPGGYFGWGGMGMFPFMMFILFLVAIYFIFKRGEHGSLPWQDQGKQLGSDSALEILKRRYAAGEISKEQFDQMRQDIS
jgi:putative membrane protein